MVLRSENLWPANPRPEPGPNGARAAEASNNNCVEVCFVGDDVPLRNSRDPDGPVLVFTAPEWDAFVEGVKRGGFDRRR